MNKYARFVVKNYKNAITKTLISHPIQLKKYYLINGKRIKISFQIYLQKILFVKLCVHFCVCVSKSLRIGHRLTLNTKVTFHPPPPPTTHPPENFFWSQMKGMVKIRLFYSGDMALILPR